jgi:hypothetical protein
MNHIALLDIFASLRKAYVLRTTSLCLTDYPDAVTGNWECMDEWNSLAEQSEEWRCLEMTAILSQPFLISERQKHFLNVRYGALGKPPIANNTGLAFELQIHIHQVNKLDSEIKSDLASLLHLRQRIAVVVKHIDPPLNVGIDQLGLEPRTFNSLRRASILTLFDLLRRFNENSLDSKVRDFGPHCKLDCARILTERKLI